MWESYKTYSDGYDYDDDLVLESIEESYRIAHERIERFLPDNTVRLPSFVVPAGYTEDEALVNATLEGLRERNLHKTLEGLRERNLHNDNEYLDRLRHELNVIADRGFSKYFLTMKAICDVSNQMMLSGPGRGSAAGSLVAYVLGITQVDPIKYKVLLLLMCLVLRRLILSSIIFCSLASCVQMRKTIQTLTMMYPIVCF
jgi:DNA polymerase-3 subunit alpha